MRSIIYIFILTFIFNVQQAHGQLDVIELINPSFEDKPHAGQADEYGRRTTIRGWYDCSRDTFPYESPPDIHPNNLWNVAVEPIDGNTYLGMVVRKQESWESVSQQLTTRLKKGSCYTATLNLTRSDNYWSATRQEADKANILNATKVKKENFTQPAVLRIWGGVGKCNCRQLLWESPPIDHSNWEKYQVEFESKFAHSFITLEAFYKTPALMPYNGHILLDNISEVREYNCNEEPQEVVIEVEEVPKEKESLKKGSKSDVDNPDKNVVVTNKNKKDKLIKDLDREALKIGQTIEINNLYFAANETEITSTSHAVLNEVYSFMKSYTDVVIEIGGHTNSLPKDEFCDKLSRDRAKSVAKYLVAKGIPASRVQFKGYGKRNPIASNENATGRKKNQRVEIKILSLDS